MKIFGRLDKELPRGGVEDKTEELIRNLIKLEPERIPPDRVSRTPDRDPGTLSTALSSTRLCPDDDSSPVPNMNRRFGKLLESLKKVRKDLEGEESVTPAESARLKTIAEKCQSMSESLELIINQVGVKFSTRRGPPSKGTL